MIGKAAFYFMCAFFFVVPWENMVTISGVGTIARLVGATAAGVVVVAVLVKKRARYHPFLLFALLFVLWSWASCLWSVGWSVTLERSYTYSQLLIASWLLYVVVDKNDKASGVLAAYALGVLVSAVFTLWSYFQGAQAAYNRFAAEGFDPNDLSVYMNLGVASALYVAAISHSLIVRLAFLAIVPLAVGAILVTASRAGMIGLGFVLIYALSTFPVLSLSARVFVVVGAILGLSWGISSIPSSSMERLLTIPSEIASGTLNERTQIWGAGLRAYGEAPVIGYGAGTFKEVAEPYGAKGYNAHNVFVGVAVELGMIGLVLWCLMIAAACAGVLVRSGSAKSYSFCVLAVLVIAFLSLNFEWRKGAWMFLALLAALGKLPSRAGTIERSLLLSKS